MNHYITYLKDTLGSNYIGVKIQNTELNSFLDQLKDILGDQYDGYISNQQKRDNGSYHITIINVMDYN